jgi:hypothetical protein
MTTSALPFDVSSGLFIQNDNDGGDVDITVSYSFVPSTVVSSGIALTGSTTFSTLTINLGDATFRSVAQGFNPSQVTITGSGATAATLAIANSNASAIQAALNNGQYSFANATKLVITGFGPLNVDANSLKVSIVRAALLLGAVDDTQEVEIANFTN